MIPRWKLQGVGPITCPKDEMSRGRSPCSHLGPRSRGDRLGSDAGPSPSNSTNGASASHGRSASWPYCRVQDVAVCDPGGIARFLPHQADPRGVDLQDHRVGGNWLVPDRSQGERGLGAGQHPQTYPPNPCQRPLDSLPSSLVPRMCAHAGARLGWSLMSRCRAR
jgi:hypothetical protein